MSAFTCSVHQLGKAPKKIQLFGDKKKPEPAQHVIEFPGGAIEVTRTTDGNYWAHILINRDWADSDQAGKQSALGEIVGSRIGYKVAGGNVIEIPDQSAVEQIAVLIKPVRS